MKEKRYLRVNKLIEKSCAEVDRFGFNGKENDKEWGSQLIQDYGFRLYNPSIGKFLSVDPLAPSYPWYTPYQFAGNKPIVAIDLDGLEELPTNGDIGKSDPNRVSGSSASDRNSGSQNSTTQNSSSNQKNNKGTRWGRKALMYWNLLNSTVGDPIRERGENLQNNVNQLEKEVNDLESKHNRLETQIAIGKKTGALSGTEDDYQREKEKGESFYRAMGLTELKNTGGLLEHRPINDVSYKGEGPFITYDKSYLTNPKSFIHKQSRKYDVIVEYIVEKGTKAHLDNTSLVHPQDNITQRAISENKPIKKIEKGAENYRFPGQTGTTHFNSKIKLIKVTYLNK